MNIAELVRAMNQKTGFELVEHTSSPTQLRLLGRVPLDRSGANMNNWLLLTRHVLIQSAKGAWSADISKDYFVRSDKLVYAWRVIFQSKSIEDSFTEILQVIGGTKESRHNEVTEMPLPGVSADRNSTEGGRRGAGLSGQVPVGPMAVHAKQMGM